MGARPQTVRLILKISTFCVNSNSSMTGGKIREKSIHDSVGYYLRVLL
jgi:hypothetical protein